MIKKLILSLSISVLLTSFSLAQWVQLNKVSSVNQTPDVQLISNSATSTVIKIDLPGFFMEQFYVNGRTYHSISFDSEAITMDAGFPEISYISKILAIPNQGSVNVEVIEAGEIQTIAGIDLPPARESWLEGQPESPYLENIEVYNSDETYPKYLARVEDPAVFRDFRIVRVSVFPIRYSPARREIQAISSITIRVNYTAEPGINPKLTPDKPIAPSFAKLYRNFIFNYSEVLQSRSGGRETGHDFMLCIMPDDFYNSFQTYAAWKHKTGTYIHSTKFSSIGASGNNPTAVRNHILDAYTNWEITPTHVLLIGDANIAPVKFISYDYTFVYDDYFVELEGNDFFPEMMIGRFTNQTDYRLQVMVNKFLGYEKTPYVSNTAWFKKGLVCSNNAYISQINTKRSVAEQMLTRGYFTSVDSLYNGSPCPGNVSSIISRINDGRSFLNYRGEGWSSGWWASCFQFNTSNVSSLNNGPKLTFVTSIGCGVAMFNASGGNSFGEEWLELGTLTEPRGASAFVGPTSNTHTAYNNRIDMGIYLGMFPPELAREEIDSPGEALLNGKMHMYQSFGNTTSVEYHFRVYHVLGDPSLHVWKKVPEPVLVIHPDTVYVGFGQVQISVKRPGSELPVANAQVCISGQDVYSIGYTLMNGTAILDIDPESAGILNITVRGSDVIPFEGIIQVAQGIENIAPVGNTVVTDIDGNLDGLINPNENCLISFSLKNYGTQASSNVTAALSIPDSIEYVQIITTEAVSYGNILPGESATGSAFQFFIKPECPVGFVIPFKLTVSSTSSNWQYFRNETVHGCELRYIYFTVDDEGNILRNYRMDPGETVKVIVNIKNTGDDNAPDVIGVLRSNDEYITIIDSIGTFNTLSPDSVSENEDDYFVVKVSENCPVQYPAGYSIQLSTQNGLYPYSNLIEFIIPVAMPSGYDPTGPDAYGYYAYSSDDTLFLQAPQFDWVEINTIGTLLPRPNGVTNLTQTVSLPFSFKYYGNNFSQIRISTDGWIAFGNGTQVAPVNYALPRQDDINNMVCIFWEDLFSTYSNETGKIYHYYDNDNHKFVIQWDKVRHAVDTLNSETFQILLLDPLHYTTKTGDGEIIFQYRTVSEPGGCTIGIEDGTETIALQYAFNDYYAVTATEVFDNTAIKFTTNTPDVVTGIEDSETHSIPANYVLEQNYPNPFNPETHISFSIPEPAFIKLNIYDINGLLVKSLLDNHHPAGRYEIIWDGKNSTGYKVASGVYIYSIQANEFMKSRKMILLK